MTKGLSGESRDACEYASPKYVPPEGFIDFHLLVFR
jgi:hypothetical protein